IIGLGYSYSVIDTSESVFQIEPGNPEQLANEIRRISSTDAGTRKTNALKSREYIKKHHSYDVLTDRLLNIINGKD
ncbi:MAG: glycosyltransferase, partial [Bacteroidota bacterium]